MGTAKQVLTIARTDLGYKESPAGSNRTKYGKWFGLNGQPWCMIFVQWCYYKAGVKLPNQTTASCGAMMRAAQAAGCWVTSKYEPGYLVIYDFPDGGATDHCGIIERVTSSGIVAIEGNTSVGSNSNGGEVMRRTRPYKYIKGAVRPVFTQSVSTAQKEDEDAVTQEQFNTMMNTWLTAQAKQEPSDSSADARKWAEKNGIIAGYADGTKRYKGFCTREQVAIMLKRMADKLSK